MSNASPPSSGQFAVLEILSKTPEATVLVYETSSGRKRVAKVFNEMTDDERRSLQERVARIAQLGDGQTAGERAIVPVQGDILGQQQPYITMPYYERGTLRSLLPEGMTRLPAVEVATIGARLAGGLRRAHDAGVEHGDVHPENIVITDDGGVALLDFWLPIPRRGPPGAAQQMSVTAPGGYTRPYAAPEREATGETSKASDVFSLCVTLLELATGSVPWPPHEVPLDLAGAARGAFAPGPGWSEEFVAAIASGCQRDPAARPRAHELRLLLRQVPGVRLDDDPANVRPGIDQPVHPRSPAPAPGTASTSDEPRSNVPPAPGRLVADEPFGRRQPHLVRKVGDATPDEARSLGVVIGSPEVDAAHARLWGLGRAALDALELGEHGVAGRVHLQLARCHHESGHMDAALRQLEFAHLEFLEERDLSGVLEVDLQRRAWGLEATMAKDIIDSLAKAPSVLEVRARVLQAKQRSVAAPGMTSFEADEDTDEIKLCEWAIEGIVELTTAGLAVVGDMWRRPTEDTLDLVDLHLRLGVLALRQAQIATAGQHFKAALREAAQEPSLVDHEVVARLAVGAVELARGLAGSIESLVHGLELVEQTKPAEEPSNVLSGKEIVVWAHLLHARALVLIEDLEFADRILENIDIEAEFAEIPSDDRRPIADMGQLALLELKAARRTAADEEWVRTFLAERPSVSGGGHGGKGPAHRVILLASARVVGVELVRREYQMLDDFSRARAGLLLADRGLTASASARTRADIETLAEESIRWFKKKKWTVLAAACHRALARTLGDASFLGRASRLLDKPVPERLMTWHRLERTECATEKAVSRAARLRDPRDALQNLRDVSPSLTSRPRSLARFHQRAAEWAKEALDAEEALWHLRQAADTLALLQNGEAAAAHFEYASLLYLYEPTSMDARVYAERAVKCVVQSERADCYDEYAELVAATYLASADPGPVTALLHDPASPSSLRRRRLLAWASPGTAGAEVDDRDDDLAATASDRGEDQLLFAQMLLARADASSDRHDRVRREARAKDVLRSLIDADDVRAESTDIETYLIGHEAERLLLQRSAEVDPETFRTRMAAVTVKSAVERARLARTYATHMSRWPAGRDRAIKALADAQRVLADEPNGDLDRALLHGVEFEIHKDTSGAEALHAGLRALAGYDRHRRNSKGDGVGIQWWTAHEAAVRHGLLNTFEDDEARARLIEMSRQQRIPDGPNVPAIVRASTEFFSAFEEPTSTVEGMTEGETVCIAEVAERLSAGRPWLWWGSWMHADTLHHSIISSERAPTQCQSWPQRRVVTRSEATPDDLKDSFAKLERSLPGPVVLSDRFSDPESELDLMEALSRAVLPQEVRDMVEGYTAGEDESSERPLLFLAPAAELRRVPCCLLVGRNRRRLIEAFDPWHVPPVFLARHLLERGSRGTHIGGGTAAMIDPGGRHLPSARRWVPADTQVLISRAENLESRFGSSDDPTRSRDLEVASRDSFLSLLDPERFERLFVVAHIESGSDRAADAELVIGDRPDERITPRELRSEAVHAPRFVYLSGCDGMGTTAGGEWLGVGPTFLLRGSAVVVTTTWPVPDSSDVDREVWEALAYCRSGAQAASALGSILRSRTRAWARGSGELLSPVWWASLVLLSAASDEEEREMVVPE